MEPKITQTPGTLPMPFRVLSRVNPLPQLPQEILIFEFRHGEFVLEDLSVTSNVMELLA